MAVSPHLYIQAGKVRGLFVTSKYRVAAYPDVPTAEAGLPGFSAVGWFGLARARRSSSS